MLADANIDVPLKCFANLRRSRYGSTLPHTSNLITQYYAASTQSTVACLCRAEVWVLSVGGLSWMQRFSPFWNTAQIFLSLYSENPPCYKTDCENQRGSSIQATHNRVLIPSTNLHLKRLWMLADANIDVPLKGFANLRRSRYGSTLPHTSNLITKYYAASKQSTIACLYRAVVWILGDSGLSWTPKNVRHFWSTSHIFLNLHSENALCHKIECENQVGSYIQAVHNRVLIQSRKISVVGDCGLS